jgi:hypothetical protein
MSDGITPGSDEHFGRIVLRSTSIFTAFAVAYVLIVATWDYGCFTRSTVMCAPTDNPMFLAIAFGLPVGAMCGLIFGILYAGCCRWGKWPKRDSNDASGPILVFIGVTVGLGIAAAIVGWREGLPEPWGSMWGGDGNFGGRHSKETVAFCAVFAMQHVFLAGGLYLCAWVLGRRSVAARSKGTGSGR